MKVFSVKNQNFLGHGAGKIKALYMQNPNLPIQIPVYNELKSIGQAHNFDVFIHGQDELLNDTFMKYPSARYCEFGVWSQDNKTIISKDGELSIISGLYMPEEEQAASQNFAEVRGIEHKKVELLLEGGNLFLGKKFDGKNYLIIGFKDVHISAIHNYLKEKFGSITYEDMDEFTSELKLNKNGIIATYEEFNKNFSKWEMFVLDELKEAFDVDKNDITILPQGQYHNDLVIRPLDYPYVLVNDEKKSEENLNRLKKFYKFSINSHLFARKHFKKIKEQNERYASCDDLCKHLEKAGFIPIKIGGVYGIKTINFINAIVHQEEQGLIYITNSGISKNKNYIFLQALFEQQLKKSCPQISRVYFVDGSPLSNGSNIVLEYLKTHKGGIHCLCAEEMCG